MNDWTLAIDYGTTYTAAAIGRADSVELLYFNGVPRIPSLILRNETGEILVGTTAENETLISPDRVLRAPKRRLGDRMVLLGDSPIAVVEAVAAVLAAVLEEARRQQGGTEPTRVVMTHPARWGSERLAALADAAARAGLPPPQFMAEPVAAALHYMATGTDPITPGQRVAVYDLGGGTFDTAVLERQDDGGFRIVATGGSEYQGGEDFDEILYRHFGELLAQDGSATWEQLRHSDERPWLKANAEFRRDVRLLKEDLATTNARSVYVRYPVDRELQLTRTELEGLLRSELERTLDELDATIQRSNSRPDELAAIYLVGGSSRIRLLPQLVRERFGRADTRDDPKAVVALGAARGGIQQVSTDTAPPTSEPSLEAREPRPIGPVEPAPQETRVSPAEMVQAEPTAERVTVNAEPTAERVTVKAEPTAEPITVNAGGRAVITRWLESARSRARPPILLAGMGAAAVLLVALLVSSSFFAGEAEPPDSSVETSELVVGDCFDPATTGTNGGVLERVVTVPCDEPHQYEVYATLPDRGATASYPSPATLENMKDDCQDAATEFVGSPVGEAGLGIYMLVPLEEQWDAGDHTITCALQRAGGEGSLTGSQQGEGDN